MYKGRFVTFFEHKQILSCICIDEHEEQLVLLCGPRDTRKLRSRRVLHCSHTQCDLTEPTEQLLEHLHSFRSRQHKLKNSIDPASLWECTGEQKEAFSVTDLAVAVFGTRVKDEHETATLYSLAEDRIYFKLKGSEFVPNPPERVAQLKNQREAEYRIRQENAQCFLWLTSISHGAEIPCPARDLCIEFLKSFAVHGTNAPRFSRFRTVLRDAGLLDPGSCFQLLVRTGIWDEDENLAVYRYNIPCTWPGDSIRQAEHIGARPDSAISDTSGRTDLTGLQTITIDDPQTKDIDDAISFEEEASFVRIGIHITDAASYIIPGSALDAEAARRGISVYFPEGKISMLPQLLSDNLLSLRSNAVRRAISFFAVLTPEGVLLDYQVKRSVIAVKQNATYNETDRLIAEDHPILGRLYVLARNLRENRIASGACSVHLAEPQVTVDDNRTVFVHLRDKELPSQVLVSECMILANFCAASFLRDNGVPALYRKQRQRGGVCTSSGNPSYHERVKLRRQFLPVQVDTAPGSHDILGLPHYITVTSPMRKYLDLVLQRQIAAFLSDAQAFYSIQQLEEINASEQPVLFHAARAQAERRRYWILKHILNRGEPELPAMVLEVKFRTCTIALCDYCIHAGITLPHGLNVSAGDRITVKIKQIDPFSGLLKLEAVALAGPARTQAL